VGVIFSIVSLLYTSIFLINFELREFFLLINRNIAINKSTWG
jgi:hypothetical protein